MSNTQSQKLMVEWHSINWRKLERSVYKLSSKREFIKPLPVVM
ncbi:MAG: hypothetical protein V7K38_15620 [Nostoc sp.]